MATDTSKSNKTKVEDEKVDKPAEPTPEGTQTTSDKQDDVDVPTEPVQKDEDDDLAAQNEADFEEEYGDDDAEGVFAPLGSVSEKDNEGNEYDVPWAYVTLQDTDSVSSRTSDSDDPTKSWTAQEATGEREDEDGNAVTVALVDVQATPGQTFRVRELPNREVAEAAGIDYGQWIAGLPVRYDVPGEAPRRGTPA